MGGARAQLRGKRLTVMGGLRWESFVVTFSVCRAGVAIEAAGTDIRVVGRSGVVFILLREVDVISWGTGLEVSFIGWVLVGSAWSFT